MSVPDNPTTVVTQVANRSGLTLPMLAAVVALATPLVGGIMWFTRLEARTTQTEKMDSRITEVEKTLAGMATIPSRVDRTEADLGEVRKSLDKINDRLLESLEALRKQVAALDSRISGIDGKLDALGPRRGAAESDPR